jgi:hypothetical protein
MSRSSLQRSKNLHQLESQRNDENGVRNHKLWTLTYDELKASMNRGGKDHCKQNHSIYCETIRGAIRTPSNVERSSHRKLLATVFIIPLPDTAVRKVRND